VCLGSLLAEHEESLAAHGLQLAEVTRFVGKEHVTRVVRRCPCVCRPRLLRSTFLVLHTPNCIRRAHNTIHRITSDQACFS
jgi:hypothetical protein